MALEKADIPVVSDLLDKLFLRQLHLMEEKMRCELNIESSINNGSIHLAKSRYIMGQSSVSTARLPVENSPEFSASIVCDSVEEDGVTQLKVTENNADNKVNPLRWFGVLVPQNLHKAQGGRRADESPDGKRLPPPMDTCNTKYCNIGIL